MDSHNLASDPRCTLSLALREFDLVVEGEAHIVTDPVTVAELARLWAEDWPCSVDGAADHRARRRHALGLLRGQPARPELRALSWSGRPWGREARGSRAARRLPDRGTGTRSAGRRSGCRRRSATG